MRTVQLFHRVLVGPCRHMAFQAFCQTPISTGGHAIHQQGLLTLHKFLAASFTPFFLISHVEVGGGHVAVHPVWSRHCVFGPFDCPMAQVLVSLVSWLLHDHMYFSEVTFSQTVSLICVAGMKRVLRGFLYCLSTPIATGLFLSNPCNLWMSFTVALLAVISCR